MARGAEVAAVLGECADSQVCLAVVQAVMVFVVDYEMLGGVGDFAVHFDAPALPLAYGVAILRRAFCEPCVTAQTLVVLSVDYREQPAGQRNGSRQAAFGVAGPGRVEVGAFPLQRADSPSAFRASSLLADQSGPCGAGGERGEKTIVASLILCHRISLPATRYSVVKRRLCAKYCELSNRSALFD